MRLCTSHFALGCLSRLTGMSGLSSNRARLASNVTYLGIFKDSFTDSPGQNEQKTDLKSPRFVPFGADLVQLEAESDMADRDRLEIINTP